MKHNAIVTRNAAWLMIQPVITGILSLVVTAIVARHLGAQGYGLLMLLLSYVAIFALMSALGLRPYSVREIAANRSRALQIVEDLLGLRFALALLAMAVGALVLAASRQLPPALIGFFVLQLLFNALSTCFVDGLYGIERMRPAATAMLLSGFVVQGGCILAVTLETGLVGVVTAYTLGSFTTFALAWRSFVREAGPVALRRPRRKDLVHIRGSWAFFMQNVVTIMRARLDIVIINGMLGAHAAGIYGAARSLLDRLDFLYDGIGTALFPRLSSLYGKADEEMHRLVQGGTKVAMVIAMPIAIGLLAVADQIIALIFGAQYGDAAGVLRIFGLSLPFIFCYSVLFNAMRAMHLERQLLAIAVFGAVTSLGLLVAGIRVAGMTGGSVGVALGFVALMVPSMFSYWSRMGAPMLGIDIARLALANALMAAALFVVRGTHLAVEIIVAATVYTAAVLALRLVTVHTLRSLRRDGSAPPSEP